MQNVTIRLTKEQIDYINKQQPSRAEFIRRLIHQHQDLRGLQAVVDGLRRQRLGRDDGNGQ